MKAIKIDTDGTVAAFEGQQDFWMAKDIDWAEGPYPGEKGHVVFYDDNALFADVQVRTTIAGHDYPIPCWIVGIDGEHTTDTTLRVQKVANDLGVRSYPLTDLACR